MDQTLKIFNRKLSKKKTIEITLVIVDRTRKAVKKAKFDRVNANTAFDRVNVVFIV